MKFLTQNIIIYKWKQEKSTSTIASKIYKSTTFYIKFLHSTRSFPPKFYIYKHPYFLQFYNIFLVFFYILQWIFWPNLQSTKTPTPPLKRDERGEFGIFSKRGYELYEAVGNGGKHYLKPEKDFPYHVCSISIARSPSFSTIQKVGNFSTDELI